tara:strand:- start:260 stop:628 length:369 start_codon:yes stop_codon:yes gene_type:complete
MDMTHEETQKILLAYKKKRAQEKARYDRLRDDPLFIEQNRARAKAYYLANKDKKSSVYKANKEIRSAKSLYNYYETQGRDQEFIERYPEKYILIADSLLDTRPDSRFVSGDVADAVQALPVS